MEPTQLGSDAARCLAELGTIVVWDCPFDDVAKLLTYVAQEGVPAARVVSVTLLRTDGTGYTAQANHGLACALDEVQYEEAAGPCLEAAATQESVNVRLADQAERWPRFVTASTNAGMRSVLASPFEVQDQLVGSLNVYGEESAMFSDHAVDIGRLLARNGGVLMANAVAYQNASRLNAQLHEALATRDLIGQAKGVLMERESCDADRAFDMLRRASQRSNKKLHNVAADLLDTVRTRDRS